MAEDTAVSSMGAAAELRKTAGGQYSGLRALLSNARVLFIAAFASFGGLLYGYQQGVLGQALVMHSFQQKFPHTAESSSAQGWLTSILHLGGWAGALSSGVLCEIFSRKHTNLGGALWVVLGSSTDSDYWTSLGLDFELDVAGNIFSIGQIDDFSSDIQQQNPPTSLM